MELYPEATQLIAAELADASSAEDAYGPSVQRLLHLLRVHAAMEVAWTSEFVGAEQVFRFVDVAPGKTGPEPGSTAPLSTAYCSRVLDGTMPAVIPDSRVDATAALLDITFELQIGAYLGVPLIGPDGSVEGMVCAISSAPTPTLDERDLVSARLIADLIEDLHRRALGSAEAKRRRDQLYDDVIRICAGEGRRPVLQPIVHIATGDVVAAEGLTRFTSGDRTPAEWFAAADTVGLRTELEVCAARTILATLAGSRPPSVISVNLSPDIVASGRLCELVGCVDPARVIVEITEHAPVESYDELHRVLDPFRNSGLRLAVDDAGAGYASMTHVLRLRPDFIKVDMSLIGGLDADPVRQSLVSAMTNFASETGASVIAEGVETRAELAALAAIGVPCAQGYLYGEPSEQPRWTGYPGFAV